MTGYNDTPIVISNPYGVSIKEAVSLFWGEVLRRFWYLFLFFAVLASKVLWDSFTKPFPMNLYAPILFAWVFLLARFRFINSIKKNSTLKRTTQMYLFEDRLEFVDSDNNHLVIPFSDLMRFSQRRIGYVIRAENNRSILIPANCFKSEVDRVRFEMLLRIR